MLKAWLLVTFMLSGKLLAESQLVSLDANFDQLYFAVQDNPSALKKWAIEKLNTPEGKESLNHAKLVATLAAACFELRCLETDPRSSEASLTEAIAQANEHDDVALIVRLEIIRLRLNIETKETAFVEKEYLRILEIAQKKNSYRLQGEVLREMSALVERTDDRPRALQQIQEALLLSAKDPLPDDLIPIIIQHDAAIHFRRVNDTERANELYRNVLDFARRHKLRHFTATSLLNFARSKISSKDPQSMNEADGLLAEAERLLQGMDVLEAQAYIFLTRGDIAFKNKNFQRALQLFDQALPLYKQLGANVWVGDVYHWRALTFFELGRYKEALESNSNALQLFPEKFTSDHYRMALSRARILHKLQNYEDSITEFSRAIDLKEEMVREFSAKNVDKLKVQLQVQTKEQQNELLKRDNALKEKELEFATFTRWLAIIFFALAALSLYLFLKSHRQSLRLQRARQEIQKILDNIDEGIISIKKNHRVESSLSSYINELLHLDKDRDQDLLLQILEKLDLSAYIKSMCTEVIHSCLGSNRLTWDFNSHHLPTDAHTADGSGRILSLSWKPVFNDESELEQIILVMRDETLKKSLEINLAQEREDKQNTLTLLLELAAQNPQLLRRFFHNLPEARQNLETNLIPGAKWTVFLQAIHTLKGDARTLGLKNLAELTHKLESAFEVKDGTARPLPTFPAAWDRWQQEASAYETLWSRLYTQESRNQNHAASPFAFLVLEVLNGLSTHLQKHQLQLNRLAITDDVISLDQQELELLRTTVLHALGNSIDHGYVLGKTRRATHNSSVELECSLLATSDGLELQIKDRGVGLDLDRLQAAAQKRGLDLKQVEDLVFMPGFSTAQAVSDTSGRGMGLSAIHEVAKQLGAELSLRNRDDGGSVLRMAWTRSSVTSSAS